ncbi:hypothetical protein lerEdw1_009203 [Lerista edwardsae]|nr:hypothetical protein lerEdw1_009203 [Lerista edwardsae]
MLTSSLPARCKKESFENPVAFPAALKWEIHDFCDINPFLKGIMKQFQDSLASGLQLQEGKWWDRMEDKGHQGDGELFFIGFFSGATNGLIG